MILGMIQGDPGKYSREKIPEKNKIPEKLHEYYTNIPEKLHEILHEKLHELHELYEKLYELYELYELPERVFFITNYSTSSTSIDGND